VTNFALLARACLRDPSIFLSQTLFQLYSLEVRMENEVGSDLNPWMLMLSRLDDLDIPTPIVFFRNSSLQYLSLARYEPQIPSPLFLTSNELWSLCFPQLHKLREYHAAWQKRKIVPESMVSNLALRGTHTELFIPFVRALYLNAM